MAEVTEHSNTKRYLVKQILTIVSLCIRKVKYKNDIYTQSVFSVLQRFF